MTDLRRLRRLAAATVAAAGAAVAYTLACGPFVTIMRPVDHVRPARVDAYSRGNVGVVREHFARRFLVQAFRRFNGRSAIPVAPRTEEMIEQRVSDAIKDWQAFRKSVNAEDVNFDIVGDRSIGNYQSVPNCLYDTFAKATATGKARADKYGATSPQMRDWLKAQDAVISSCWGGLTLPDPAPASADALTRADRSYQTAAAYFYGQHFDEAFELFRKIAADASSPWRPYGHYLAGRARLRQATLGDPVDADDLHAAQTELRATLADPSAAFLHASAAGLIDFATYRLDPGRLLGELARTLATADTGTQEQVDSYERLMDNLLTEEVSYSYVDVKERDAIVKSGELSDWILVMQGTGPEASARAIEQWKKTGSAAWLAASLWKATARDADAPALLDAAARLAPTSPASLTVGFLRVRLLTERGNVDEARAALAALPRTAATDDDVEAINLLNAERFMLARSMDELLAAAPRFAAAKRLELGTWRDPEEEPEPGPLKRDPVFDDDSGIVFSDKLPETRLVEASLSTALPARLRVRVASAAFVRAWMLDRMDEALKVAPVLRTLSPSAAADVRRFESAAPADRHIAGLRLILRTPGLRANVVGVEDDLEGGQGLSRSFDHLFQRNWWCAFSPSGGKPDWPSAPLDSEILSSLYRSAAVPGPLFLSSEERADLRRERDVLAKTGAGSMYLADQAVEWAKSRPKDLDAAEALAHAVEGTRWAGCADDKVSASSRSAFQTLHKLFPQSEWALKTKYWY
jgi:hypothetical protein